MLPLPTLIKRNGCVNSGGNSDGKLYLNRLLSEGKVTPIADFKAEDFKAPSWYDKKKYERYVSAFPGSRYIIIAPLNAICSNTQLRV